MRNSDSWKYPVAMTCLLCIWVLAFEAPPAFAQSYIPLVSCEQRGGPLDIQWSEPLAVGQIIHRYPIAIPAQAFPLEVSQARAQICLTIGTHGEVLETARSCGDPALVDAAMASVKHWRFKPLEDRVVKTYLTFEWREDKAGLIWDFKDYPVTKSDAKSLVRALPKVRSFLKHAYTYLDIDWYPEERDGIFYSLHSYGLPPGPGPVMTFTQGWYDVNAYTGEVWESLISFKKMDSPSLRKLRQTLMTRPGFPKKAAQAFLGVDPYHTDSKELTRHPCANRPVQR